MADDSMSDDVFESNEEYEKRMKDKQQTMSRGYPGYRPSRAAVRLYGWGSGFDNNSLSSPSDKEDDEDFDGWKSYRYDEVDHEFNPHINHKTILLGDSGVGKTSVLMKYNTGEFKLGCFSATVGIALTKKMNVRRQSVPIFGPSVTPHNTPVLQRRESLVKPTWHSVLPGQVSSETLEKVNIGSGNNEIRLQQDQNGIMINNNTTIRSDFKTTRKQNEEFDLFGKVMLLGDSGVGKTCLLVRFRDGTFLSGNFISTVGIDFRNKIVMVEHTKVKLQIWDTAGQERFRSVTHAYYRDAHALLLLYDVTSKTSFDNIRAWLAEIKEYAQDDVVIMLLGNKCDCDNHDRVIKREDGERLAKEYRVAFMETSAKTGLNVELAFLAVARQLKCRRSNSVDESKFNVQDFVREQTHQKQTCPPCNM